MNSANQRVAGGVNAPCFPVFENGDIGTVTPGDRAIPEALGAGCRWYGRDYSVAASAARA